MKKIFSLILIVVSINGLAQFPMTQGMATGNTRLQVNGAVDARKGLINGLYVDTLAANADFIDFYTGAQIYTTSDGNLWLRIGDKWVRLAKFTEVGGSQTLQQTFDTEVGGSVLTKSDTIATGSHTLKILTSTGGGNPLSVISTTGPAINATTTTGRGISSTTTTGIPVFITNNHTNTNTAEVMMTINRQVNGTSANGVGGDIQWNIEADNGSLFEAGRIGYKFSNVAAAGPVAEFDIGIAANYLMNIQTAGIVRVNNNADTLATKAYARSVGGAGGSGDVTKVGTPVNNQVAVWTGDGTIEGDADLTFDGSSTLAVGGVTVPTISSTNTLTNKRWTARVGSTTSSGTPTINTDNVDIYKLTAQTADITSFTTNLSGTPDDGDVLEIQVTGTASRAITWGASFVSSTVILPASTSGTITLTVIFQWFTTSSYGNNTWVCASYF